MWFKSQQPKNRRLHRHHVLDVKLRSDHVRAGRMRLFRLSFLVVFGTFAGLYLLWRAGELALDAFVYDNPDFAIEQIEAHTNGKIALEQLRRWTGVKLGANLIALDLADVKRKLELVSVIDSVSVERVLPHTLRVRVTERDPIAQVNVPQADANGGISVAVYQLDADGVVIQPLDPRDSTIPLAQINPQLPVIAGLNYFQLQPGRRIELPQVQAALRLIGDFNRSTLSALVDLQRLDVSQPRVLVATTEQGVEVTFGLDNLPLQLQRWQQIFSDPQRIYNLSQSYHKAVPPAKNIAIAAVDLAVGNNIPIRWMTNAIVPVVIHKTVKPLTPRRRHV